MTLRLPASLPLLAILTALGLIACRPVVEATYPGGEPKVIRTYGRASGEAPPPLKREQTFYFNGKPEKDAHYRDGRLHGPYAEFWHNGQKKVSGEYVDGRKEGTWQYYFNQYAIASSGSFRNDLKEGPWIELWENGALKAEGEYRAGRETGTWKRYANGGDLIEESSCFEGQAEGRYRSYHADKTLKEDYLCRNGAPIGAYERKNPEGGLEEKGRFDSTGKKDGEWVTFHASGQPASRRAYAHGVETDSLLAWDAAGRVRERGFFREGAGEVLAFDSLGRLTERKRYLRGRPDGENWTYHPDGKRKSLVEYRDGQAVVARRWHANGALAAEGAFAQGKRTGEWKVFGENGQLLDRSRYVDGLLHGERTLYDSAGKRMQVMRYERGYPAEGSFPGGLPDRYPEPGKESNGQATPP